MAGWQLGSDPEIQVATVVTNHLTAAVLKYFADSFRLDRAANLFERMAGKEPEVAALLARSYIGMSGSDVRGELTTDEEIRAVRIMHSALEANPLSYPILHAQCDLLLSKGKVDWARRVAQQAVNSAPSEFVTWAKLTETYIELGHFDAALLTLNSCPMFTFNERDLHRMPSPARTHLPVKRFIAESNILDEESARDNEADVALLRLPAPGLRGTFAKAYALLTLLVSKIGWDELLKTRSQVFVMEEEYRLHKTAEGVGEGGGEGEADEADGADEADDNASTVGIRSPLTPSEIPTIRISSESTREPNGHVEVRQPETAQATEEPLSAFSNKRLCERWLGGWE